MTDDDQEPNETEDAFARWPVLAALAIAALMALLTISLQYPMLPHSGTVGDTIALIIFPGMLGSMEISGNVHDLNLWIAAGINFIFYFLALWLFCIGFRWIVPKFR